ncbi:hypothetical protein PT279_08010 [Bifidobacterium sp. ESL0784]|uniref:hypothetical protein n=1 Tax=Bifidobacterium sp. ESL0784 TaxID=2983231 RepID=UPI0023F76B0A|nr:hypothetical protein [Bifidobacterium sp. ESL0784]MDF7641528.1 hypothetical protein [Bifidobacterium sp. ESL0784]
MKKNAIVTSITGLWSRFSARHHGLAEFIMFFIVCNAVTVLQLILMPVLKWIFGMTSLVNTSFQVLRLGHNLNGSIYYLFDYAAGAVQHGGGGGLAYFLAVELTMAIAQIINFFMQRNITFKAVGSIWTAAFWYAFAYVVVTFVAAALQGWYKAPLYRLFVGWMGSGFGVTLADLVTMLINCALSFWVFYPIMKLIFKQK